MDSRVSVASLFSHLRQIRSPVTADQLKPLDPRCERVQFDSPLTDDDHRQVSKFMERYPQVALRVYGHYFDRAVNLDFLKHYPHLRRFSVDLFELRSLEPLSLLPDDMEELGISQTRTKAISLKCLEKFPRLRVLHLESQTKDFDVVHSMQRLETLNLRSITLPNLDFVKKLGKLQSFTLCLGGTKRLEGLRHARRLRYLGVAMVKGLDDVSVLASLRSLQSLELANLPRVLKLPSLAGLDRLRDITLDSMKGLTDLKPVAHAPGLERFYATNMKHLEASHFKPFVRHRTLQKFSAYMGSLRKNKEVTELVCLPPITPGFEFIDYPDYPD